MSGLGKNTEKVVLFKILIKTCVVLGDQQKRLDSVHLIIDWTARVLRIKCDWFGRAMKTSCSQVIRKLCATEFLNWENRQKVRLETMDPKQFLNRQKGQKSVWKTKGRSFFSDETNPSHVDVDRQGTRWSIDVLCLQNLFDNTSLCKQNTTQWTETQHRWMNWCVLPNGKTTGDAHVQLTCPWTARSLSWSFRFMWLTRRLGSRSSYSPCVGGSIMHGTFWSCFCFCLNITGVACWSLVMHFLNLSWEFDTQNKRQSGRAFSALETWVMWLILYNQTRSFRLSKCLLIPTE